MKLRYSVTVLLFFLSSIFLPDFVLANGGDQRVVEGKYIINVSKAPFTPRVGEENKMLVSFADIAKDQLIADDLLVNIRVAKLNRGRDEENHFLFRKEKVVVHGGVLEFPYTFAEPGLHELFFDFAFASQPEKVYEAPDFLLDVQPPANPASAPSRLATPRLFLLAIGLLIGGITGWLLARLQRRGE